MAIETVFILGAGASRADGAPLQSELFGAYQRALNGPESIQAKMDNEIASFFQAFFGVDLTSAKFDKSNLPTFEEVLGIIEIALERGESFRDFGVDPQNPRLQRMREHFIGLIGNMLGNIARRGAVHHPKLISRLRRQGSLIQTSFISLNYDTFIDNALADLRGVDIDYGVKFAKLRAEGFRRALLTSPWHQPRPARSVALYKLHGSLNWLHCHQCGALIIVPKGFPFVAPIEIPCGCGSLVSPVIVPPTFFKRMSSLYLQQIWRNSEDALMSARKIVFCGYSLPDADLHIRYLLKRAEVNRRGKPPKVYVVNDHDQKTCEDRSAEMNRYRRLWRDPGLLHFKKLSFEGLCDSWPGILSDAPEWQ